MRRADSFRLSAASWILIGSIMIAAVCCLGTTGCLRSAAARPFPDPGALRPGDVVFQSLSGDLPDLVEGVTDSPWSHCGLVIRDEAGGLCVLEAIADGVVVTPLEAWIRRGRGGRGLARRLRPRFRTAIPEWIRAAKAHMSKPYDSRFRLDDEAIYCSELVWKAFRRATGQSLGPLVPLRELDWRPRADAIRALEDGPVPLDREIITPHHLAHAPQLMPVQ